LDDRTKNRNPQTEGGERTRRHGKWVISKEVETTKKRDRGKVTKRGVLGLQHEGEGKKKMTKNPGYSGKEGEKAQKGGTR